MQYYRGMTKLLLLGGLLLGACSGSGSGRESPSLSGKLFLNELGPSNQDIVTDEYGEPDDWIEIFNAGDVPIDMLGCSLGDSSGTSQTIQSSVAIPAGGFQLFWADDSPAQGANHLGFKLSATKGDSVILRDPTGMTIDQVSFPPATGQITYARFPDGLGAFAWCAAPTPGASNGLACAVP
jgi:hypothetical protein